MKEKAARIIGTKRLEKITALTLLAHIPERGTLSRQEVAAQAGLVPFCRDSGLSSTQRYICRGRKRLRACMYIAAVCAIQHHPVMREFYLRLVKKKIIVRIKLR